jgi:HD-like signal output (HDOD) protein
MATLKERLETLNQLPSLPIATLKLIRILGQSEVAEYDEVEEIVQTDSALVSAVLKTANSALFAPKSGKVATIGEALRNLGLRKIQEIAIAHQTGPFLGKEVEGYGLLGGQLWQGALAGAIASQVIATNTKKCPPGEAFVGGLLRDIGKLVMQALFGEQLMISNLHAGDSEWTQCEHERKEFGFDHSEIGSELALLWKLPEALVKAIRFHHNPPDDQDIGGPLVDVVHIGDTIALAMGCGTGLDGLHYEASSSSLERIGLKRPDFEQAMVETRLRLDAFQTHKQETGT